MELLYISFMCATDTRSLEHARNGEGEKNDNATRYVILLYGMASAGSRSTNDRKGEKEREKKRERLSLQWRESFSSECIFVLHDSLVLAKSALPLVIPSVST